MKRYLNPKIDLLFKRIFGEHADILMSFLNATLPLPEGRKITELSYLPTEQVPVIENFKNTIADVKCKDSEGNIFIVEMQMQWTASFTKRLLFGASSAYVRQLHQSELYHTLAPVMAVGLIDDVFDKDAEQWYHHYRITNQGNVAKTIDDLQLVLIEIPKFKAKSIIEKKMQILWLRFLSELDENTTEVPQELLEVPEIRKAIELSEESAYTPAELEAYEKYWDSVRVQRAYTHDARKESHAEGKVEGIAEGMEKGIEKGRSQEKLEIARNMLAKSIPIETIAEITELSIDTIQQLTTKQKTD